MKKIKINFCKYDPNDTCSYSFYIINILRRHYDVEISEKPDYLFFNTSDSEHIFFDNCIKIFYTGENTHPNFNICDYAIGFDHMNFGDRYYRLPIYMVSNFYRAQEIEKAQYINFAAQRHVTHADIQHKESFCSFVYSNYLADQNRKIFFDKLSAYKKVNSGGKYMNNIGKICEDKLLFESQHKFSIAFENSSRDGYTTEKLLNSIAAHTIPIYWGNPKIAQEFNTDSFINCHDFSDFDQVIARIKEIDENDSEYLKIINTPFLQHPHQLKDIEAGFEKFLLHIFNQNSTEAKRLRINQAIAADIAKDGVLLFRYHKLKSRWNKILAMVYSPLKNITFIRKIKENLFINKIHRK